MITNTLVTAQHSKGQQTTAQPQKNSKNLFICELHKKTDHSFKKTPPLSLNNSLLGLNSFKPIKQLKIAIVASGEYSNYFINKENAHSFSISQKKAIVLNAIQKTLNNSNKILRRDLGIELVLVEANEKLIFLDPKIDGLNAGSSIALISQLHDVITSIIPHKDFDIGHAFTTTIGGLSTVGSALGPRKAQGVTGAPFPEGKIFDIDFFTHEIGHQIGATHTQNSKCSRNAFSTVEPGSGSTIMGYAGVCNIPESNVINTSQPFFHNYSIYQIKKYLTDFFVKTKATPNYGLEEIPNFKIPKETLFEVNLKAKKPENSEVWYSCDQIDTEISEFPPKSNATKGPIFTSQNLGKSPIISFPNSELVFNGYANSRKGILSSVARSYNFLASARIKNKEQYLTSLRKFHIEVLDILPFEITSQNSKETIWIPNTKETITWNVGATKSKLNTEFVTILLSNNNGKSFDYTLAEKTPNDGFETIKVPSNISSSDCRIKIKAYNSIYYTINKELFSISPFQELNYSNNNPTNIKAETTSEIEVSDQINYTELQVSLKLEYTDVSKLQIALQNPSGKSILLWDTFCSKDTQLDLRFKDKSLEIPKSTLKDAICEPLLIGFRTPAENIEKLSDKTAGMWYLNIKNNEDSNENGILHNWKLHFKVKGLNNENIVFKNNDIRLFPNPTKDNITLQLVETTFTKTKLEVFTLKGDLALFRTLKAENIQKINIEELSKGIYFFKITNGNTVSNQKIVIQ